MEFFGNKVCPSDKNQILPACPRIIVIGDLHGDWNVTKKYLLNLI